MNHLAREKSPYLLQHADNPVDWRPWGPEAFEKAKRENKPIFLSIGYATCHWCHVMERESFVSPEIAKILNDHFIAIKVDREERPDIDALYMQFVVATTGHGGWPMTVFLTPDLKPFTGGTYFPPEDRGDMPGFRTVLSHIHQLWTNDKTKVLDFAQRVKNTLWENTPHTQNNGSDLSAALLDSGYEQFKSHFDQTYGGFGGAPKFPSPPTLNFLLHYHHRNHNQGALDMVLKTLRAMADGGMYDHLGGGFHRYSTDRRWFVPHFEKMLYDQAQLTSIYLDAFQITHDPIFSNIARNILDYVLREMTGSEGQFFCAQDADSAVAGDTSGEKREGAFFIWNSEEIFQVLPEKDAVVFNYRYGVEDGGNVENDPFGEFVGQNILYLAHSLEQTADQFSKPQSDISQILTAARQKLLQVRNSRPHPALDDKTLVSWNGLMIGALARASRILREPLYLQAAVKAAGFIRTRLYNAQDNTLQRRWREGEAGIQGFLDDYAFFIQALLDLYENTLDIQWLELAIKLQAAQDKLFRDPQAGGYFFVAASDQNQLPRNKDRGDNAEPAGNSIAVLNLLRLSHLLDWKNWRAQADKTLKFFAQQMQQSPTSWTTMLTALDFYLNEPQQIVLAGDPAAKDTQVMLHAVFNSYLPCKIVLGADNGAGQVFLGNYLDFIKKVKPIKDQATAYLCRNYTCQAPITDPAKLTKQLEEQ
jgi:uncharacterized protein